MHADQPWSCVVFSFHLTNHTKYEVLSLIMNYYEVLIINNFEVLSLALEPLFSQTSLFCVYFGDFLALDSGCRPAWLKLSCPRSAGTAM